MLFNFTNFDGNLLLLIDKYNIKELKPPKEAAVIVAEKKIKPFKYIQMSLLKIAHKKMYRFIRLVDFIVMGMLQTLVATAVDILQKQVEASFNCKRQPYLKGISQMVDQVLGVHEQKLTVPLFETSLTLVFGNISIILYFYTICEYNFCKIGITSVKDF